MERTRTATASIPLAVKLREVAALFKLRLASLVVVSAALGYLMGVPEGAFSWPNILLLSLAGFLVTGASNALNQVIEQDQDALMSRTNERPLVRGTLSAREAIVIAVLAGTIGVVTLWAVFGPLSGILGLLALFMYAALYTPLKRYSPWAVFVGALPGAIPPMLGFVAAQGHFGLGPGLQFLVQFVWQFPHFWAIAWVLDDDYAKAGFRLLPSKGGRDARTAAWILFSALMVVPAGMLPWYFGFSGSWSMVVAVAAGLLMVVPAIKLFRTRDRKDARRLMFASFLHLPLVQLAYVLDRI
ncbi:MAG: heme o synthase [Flavobacteriales bacterium]